MLPVLPLRKFTSRVEALARTLEPSAEITCAYMCCEERYTHRRTASSSRSFRRERRARRRRITFLSLILLCPTSSWLLYDARSHRRNGQDRKSTRLNSSHVRISYA